MDIIPKSYHFNEIVAESEERFRALVTATSDVVYQMSPDWHEMRRLKSNGFLPDTTEPVSDWMEKYIFYEDREMIWEAIRRAINTKSMFQLEHKVINAEGSVGWTFSRAVPVLNDEGEIIEWFGIADDVTHRKQVEEALNDAKELAEQQKRLYETITSSTPDLIYVFDLNYKFTYANEALLTMWGRSWENAIGRTLLENGYEPWHAEMHEREIDKVVETKLPVRGEVGFPHAKLGRRIYDYIFTPVLNDNGQVEAVAGTTRDITDIRMAEMTLAESEARFRNMAEGSNIYISMTDETGRIIYVNQAWCKLTGQPTQALMGHKWISVLHPEDLEKHLGNYHNALAAEIPFHDNYRVQSAENTYRWLLVDGAVRRYNNGSFAGFIISAFDITQLKEDEQRKNDFISMVSHELKTPLTSTLGYIQISKTVAGKNNDDFTRTMMERTEKQVKKMTRMINSFLNLSRLESGKLHIELRRFDMALLMKEIEEEVQATILTHRLTFSTINDAWVMGDYDKIEEVIQNLLSNAVKYSSVDSEIHIACMRKDSNMLVTVSDDGVGIKEDDLPRIFERFYRVSDMEMRNIAGFGIGLYLCAEIIKRHGGAIWAESSIGKGSTFLFTLPAA